MINAETAMRQACMTAEAYALEGAKVYLQIFGGSIVNDPKAAAAFIGEFMRTAAHDFDVAMRENQQGKV